MIYTSLQKLAKSVKYQNLFVMCKEISSFRLFKNVRELSSLQELFMNYLYNFESINRDIFTEKISKHVLDEDIYWESYLLWRQKENRKNKEKEDKKTGKTVSLVAGKRIKFDKR